MFYEISKGEVMCLLLGCRMIEIGRRRSVARRPCQLWLSGVVVAIDVIASICAGAEAATINDPLRGVNMRLVPYRDVGSATPGDELIHLNDARLDLSQRAGFSLVRIGVPMEPWIEGVSIAEQEKTRKLLRETLSSALAKSLSTDVVLFVPARKIVCEKQYRDAYRSGLQAVLAGLPDRPDVGIEVVSEPPSCGNTGGAIGAWGELQRELYRIVRSMKHHIRFVVAGGGWGGIDGLLPLDPAPYKDDPNAMFTFHYYEPFLYTHQEVTWLRSDHVNKYVTDLGWPVESANSGHIRDGALAALAEDQSVNDDARREDNKSLSRLFNEYTTQGTAGYLSSRFQGVVDWAEVHGLPTTRILLGEFGVHRHMPATNVVGDPWPTAAAWLAAVRQQAERRNMGWVVWDLDSGFGVICGKQSGEGELCPAYRSVFAK
jgi:hypothetical protein